jgi:hypothetical protein
MLLDRYFHLIWYYFMVVIWMVHGWSEDIYFFCLFNLALSQLQKFNSANQDFWDAFNF